MPFVLTWHPSHESPPRTGVMPAARWPRRSIGGATGRRACATRAQWADDDPPLADGAQGTDLRARPAGSSRRRRRRCPSSIGGVRNWDYRYCWVRDAAFTLWALNIGGYSERGAALPRLAAARRRPAIQPTLQMHVRRGRRAPAARVRAALAAGLRGIQARARRQRRGRAVPARRLRRDRRRAPPGASDGPRARRRTSWRWRGCWSSTSRSAGASPTRASGRCAARAATSPTRR